MTTPFPEIAQVQPVSLDRGAARSEELGQPIAAIRRLVCLRYGLTRAEIEGQRRLVRLARPRHVAFWLALRVTGASASMVGRVFGGRDHTTVLHGARRVDERRRRDGPLREWTDRIVTQLDGEQ